MRTLLALPLMMPMLALAASLSAQDHDHSAHAAPAAPAQPAEPEAPEAPVHDHAAMVHAPAEPLPMDHSAMDNTMPPPATNTAPPARAFEGPDHAADAIWGAPAMAPSRHQIGTENGNMRNSSIMVERLEARLGNGDAYLWDVQAFYGGDLDRFVLKSEGEGALSNGHLEDAEVQALWSHAITPFFDLQAGGRLDLEPQTRSHLVLGVQGLAPYWWHIDAAAFLSDKGNLTARVKAEYDQKITQRLILQPRVELDLAAQDIPERGIGAGLSSIDAGLRLRYEIVREFAPYVGVEWSHKLGGTADFARANGDDASSTAVLLGIRTWF